MPGLATWRATAPFGPEGADIVQEYGRVGRVESMTRPHSPFTLQSPVSALHGQTRSQRASVPIDSAQNDNHHDRSGWITGEDLENLWNTGMAPQAVGNSGPFLEDTPRSVHKATSF